MSINDWQAGLQAFLDSNPGIKSRITSTIYFDSYKANEMYRELELYDGDTKIGEAEVDINGKMLSRLSIMEPYQNRGYGQAIVKKLIEDYGITCLWVNADNARAIHVYEKCGFTKERPTMYLMERKGGAE